MSVEVDATNAQYAAIIQGLVNRLFMNLVDNGGQQPAALSRFQLGVKYARVTRELALTEFRGKDKTCVSMDKKLS
jgi:hypothetical protein